MLPEALENFSSPCLGEGWQSFSAFAGVFCMISSFALQLLELAAISNVERIRANKSAQIKCMDLEKVSDPSLPRNYLSETTQNSSIDSRYHEHEGHVHSAGIFEQDDGFKHIGTLILELGIVMHSIIIGITLSNTGSDEFVTLLIALVFHQVRFILKNFCGTFNQKF